jgi:hypothetical protein
MPLPLMMLAIGISLMFISFIFYSVVRRKIDEKQSILWFVIGIVFLALSVAPQTFVVIADVLGIVYKPSLLFLLGIIFCLMIVFFHAIHITKLSEQNRKLAQQLGILELELSQMKKKHEE